MSQEPSQPVTVVTATTGTKPETNWELAKDLYLKGVKSPEIARQVGATDVAIRSRALRHGWTRLRQERATLTITKVTTKATNNRLKAQAKIGVLLDSLPDQRVPLSKLGRVASTARDIVTSMASIEGWADSTTSQVDIHMLGSDPQEVLSGALPEQSPASVLPEHADTQPVP